MRTDVNGQARTWIVHLAGCLIMTMSAQANVLINGGFDDYDSPADGAEHAANTPVSWQAFAEGGAATPRIKNNEAAQSGSWFTGFYGNDNPVTKAKGIYQSFPCTVGTTYRIEFYLARSNASDFNPTLKADIYDGNQSFTDGTGNGDLASASYTGGIGYKLKTFFFTAASTSATIRIQEPDGVASNSRDPKLDSISITAIQELQGDTFDDYTDGGTGTNGAPDHYDNVANLTPTKWKSVGSGAALYSITPETAPFACVFSQNLISTSPKGLIQTAATTQGMQYDVTFSLRRIATARPVKVRLDVFDGFAGADGTGTGDITNSVFTTSDHNNWASHEVSFVATSAMTTLRIMEPAGYDSRAADPMIDTLTVEGITRGTLIMIR